MRTALIVEREPFRSVCDLITPGGVRVVCAGTPARAAQLLEEGLRPRLVLVDLSGLPFLRALDERTPVLVLADRPTSARVHAVVARHGALGALPTRIEDWRLVQVVDRLTARPAAPARPLARRP